MKKEKIMGLTDESQLLYYLSQHFYGVKPTITTIDKENGYEVQISLPNKDKSGQQVKIGRGVGPNKKSA